MTRQFTPDEAVERYLKERKSDLSDSTLYNYKSNLGIFTEWCSYQSHIDHISDVGQFDISDFKMYKRDEGEVEETTLYNAMMSLRTFVKWCESKGLLEGLSENIILPDRGRASRTETISPERVEDLLDYLNKYEYATRRHAVFSLLWDTGLRLGAARSLDLEDYHSTESYVELHHQPSEEAGETPLKNGNGSEREVNLHGWVGDIIDDHIDGHRKEVTDKVGRFPLFTTSHGRIHRNTLRKNIRAITRPCYYTGECPIDREIEECVATEYDKAAKCPEGIKPHSIRRSAITAWLNDGHAKEIVSDRMDVSVKVLDKHYDQRTEEQKREMRRDLFDMD